MNAHHIDIHGFLGPVDDLRARVDALGEDEIPSEWTPEHVGVRLIEAFEVLSRSGARVGPGQYGNGWPAMVHEFADMIDAQARDLAEKEKEQARASRPTSDEVSRMNEALAWPMAYLGGTMLGSDALTLWAYAKATGRDMDGMLNHRKKRAMAMAAEKARRANADPHPGDCRSMASQWRAALRRQIAREISAACNEQLEHADKALHAEIKKSAWTIYHRRCRDFGCQAVTFKPVEGMPGRVLARTTLDRYRKKAMAIVADALRLDGVAVR